MAAGVVAHSRPDVLWDDLQVRQDVVDRLVGPLGSFERLVGVVDVGLMVLVMVEPHRLLVDVGLERCVVIRERWDLEWHRWLLLWLSRRGYAPRAQQGRAEGPLAAPPSGRTGCARSSVGNDQSNRVNR
jgi:hypothetical protein